MKETFNKGRVTGLSTYEVWLQQGNTGTEEEFIDSLKGADGKSAYQIWLEQGNTGTEEEFIDSLVADNKYINVKKYGAIGDGVTDDTIAINLARQTAIDLKKALYFPTGTYLISNSIELWSGAEIYGCGERSIIKKIPAVTQIVQNQDSLVKGQTSVKVLDASKYAVGQGCYIGSDILTCDWCPTGVITAIDTANNTITFDSSLRKTEKGITADLITYKKYYPHDIYFSTSFPIFCTYSYTQEGELNPVFDVNIHDLCVDGNTQEGEARAYVNSCIHIDIMKATNKKNVDNVVVEMIPNAHNERIRINNVTALNSSADGFSLQSVKDGSITNCTAKNCKYNGIHFGVGSKHIYISGNKCFNCAMHGYYDCAALSDVSVSGNAFVDCLYGIGGLDSATRGYSIDGNNFTRCSVGILGGNTYYSEHDGKILKMTASSTSTTGIIISNNSFHGNEDSLTGIGILCDEGINTSIIGNTFRYLASAFSIKKTKNAQFKNNIVEDCVTPITCDAETANKTIGCSFIGNTIYAGMTGTSAKVAIANVGNMIIKDNIINGKFAELTVDETTSTEITKADNIVIPA